MTAPPVVVCAASRADARAIVEIVRAGFEPGRLAMTIYGCRGIDEYIAAQIEAEPRGSDVRFLVARIEDRPVGCLEMRNRPGLAWVNYVAVLPEWRARRIGSMLLAAGTAPGSGGDRAGIGLDVFDDNGPAVAWYEGLGFRDGGTRQMAIADLPDRDDEPFVVSGWPLAEQAQRAFGFSELRIVTARTTVSVGRLGDEWFRLGAWSHLAEPGVAAGLRAIDPRRRVLVTDETTVPLPADGRVVARLRRMQAVTVDVRARLGDS